ncbi:molybdenum cofactor guanylyltransferase [Gulosibacter bifidus]|uniref:Molybdenum cofactor guanylyltransferase n=1 Tax=Gulosibacter bifidus TaxID=272239 RepID=A0ABW5RHH1_9MICO|nr:molybdenum cofactor guanylyltransferase [Gulosibacter bifidus]
MTAPTPHAAIILTGGRSSRMNKVHKPALELSGKPLADHVITAVRATNPAARILIAGTSEGLTSPEVQTLPDSTPYAGPLAGICSALPGLDDLTDGTVCILAGDMPFLSAATLQRLAEAATTRPASCVDGTGRMQMLVTAWPLALLRQQVAAIDDPNNGPVKWLFRGVEPVLVSVPDAELRDIDTPQDYRAAQAAR